MKFPSEYRRILRNSKVFDLVIKGGERNELLTQIFFFSILSLELTPEKWKFLKAMNYDEILVMYSKGLCELTEQELFSLLQTVLNVLRFQENQGLS